MQRFHRHSHTYYFLFFYTYHVDTLPIDATFPNLPWATVLNHVFAMLACSAVFGFAPFTFETTLSSSYESQRKK